MVKLRAGIMRTCAATRSRRLRETVHQGQNDGLCECCGRPAFLFYLDHCHKTGAFRGWVCNPCNSGFGIADDIELLEKRVAFLEAHKKKERIALIRATEATLN
jgi:hypothetical protein